MSDITTIKPLPDVQEFTDAFREMAAAKQARMVIQVPADATVAFVVAVIMAAKREGYENTMFLPHRLQGTIDLGFELEGGK